jgi:hypothetical protein
VHKCAGQDTEEQGKRNIKGETGRRREEEGVGLEGE